MIDKNNKTNNNTTLECRNEEVKFNKRKTIKKAFKQDLGDALKIAVKRGNVITLAIGVLVGAAFGAVVNSLANDIIMNAIAKALNVRGVEALSTGTTIWTSDGLPVDGIKYGKFLSVCLSFILITAIILATTLLFIVIYRRIIRRRQEKHIPPPAPDTNVLILEELQKMNNFLCLQKEVNLDETKETLKEINLKLKKIEKDSKNETKS